MDLTSAIAGGFLVPRARGWGAVGWRTWEWQTRERRLGRGFGRRLTRLPSAPPSPAPLYSLGTAARIERLRSRYAADGHATEARPTRGFPPWSA